MIVAVESNFVLELTFRQDEADEGERLIELARAKSIQLVIPACSLFEPHETLGRRKRLRDEIRRKLEGELRELGRSQTYANIGENSEIVTRALSESGEVQARELEDTIDKILSVATVIPLTAEILRQAVIFQLWFPLSSQDSIVFASIDHYLREQGQGKKVFANKNRNDFLRPGVEAYFEKYDCKLLPRFSDARKFVEHLKSLAARGADGE